MRSFSRAAVEGSRFRRVGRRVRRHAEQSAAPAPASGYGTQDLQVVNVTFDRFEPLGSGIGYASNCCQQGLAGERWITGRAAASSFASIDAGLVPNGADLEQVSFYVLDDTAAVGADFVGRLCRSWVDVDGGNLDGDCPLLATTSGSPGQTVVGGDPNIQIRYQFDVDEDGEEEVVPATSSRPPSRTRRSRARSACAPCGCSFAGRSRRLPFPRCSPTCRSRTPSSSSSRPSRPPASRRGAGPTSTAPTRR